MIKSLTSLRGIFILFIFLHHCRHLYVGGGTMAVAFFFVLGGFSMAIGYKERAMHPGFNYKNYLTRRCIKFYPLHWLCLLASLPLVSFSLLKVPVFFVNAALLQSLVPVKGVYFSFNMVSWYLANTMFFSVFFPFIFRIIVRASTKKRILIATLLVFLYLVIAISLPQKWYHAILYVNPIMRFFDFIFGVFLAVMFWQVKDMSWFQSRNNISQLVIIFVIAILVIESYLLPENIQMIAPVYWPFVAILILLAPLYEVNSNGGGGIVESRILQRLGELSFTIFLTHQLVIRYSKLVLDKIQFFDNNIVFICLTFILTLIVSIIVEKYILKPITQWLTKRNQRFMIARS